MALSQRMEPLQIEGNGEAFLLLCRKVWPDREQTTSVCNISHSGCVVRVSTEQRQGDGTVAVAEALTFVPGVHLDTEENPPRLRPIATIHPH